jgi:hypothetical protein
MDKSTNYTACTIHVGPHYGKLMAISIVVIHSKLVGGPIIHIAPFQKTSSLKKQVNERKTFRKALRSGVGSPYVKRAFNCLYRQMKLKVSLYSVRGMGSHSYTPPNCFPVAQKGDENTWKITSVTSLVTKCCRNDTFQLSMHTEHSEHVLDATNIPGSKFAV